MKDYNNPNGSNNQNPKEGAGEDPKRKDPEMQEKSGGPEGQNKDREQPNKDSKQGKEDYKNVGEGDAEPELPSKEREEKPYIGDNPEETKREAPKMK